MGALAPEVELPKGQDVRLLDVFVIGPLMVWGGVLLADQHPVRGNALAAMGVGTVLFNGYNYLRLRELGY